MAKEFRSGVGMGLGIGFGSCCLFPVLLAGSAFVLLAFTVDGCQRRGAELARQAALQPAEEPAPRRWPKNAFLPNEELLRAQRAQAEKARRGAPSPIVTDQAPPAEILPPPTGQ